MVKHINLDALDQQSFINIAARDKDMREPRLPRRDDHRQDAAHGPALAFQRQFRREK